MMDSGKASKLTADQTIRFKRLAMPHLAILLRTAKYLSHHEQKAEDLVQETMIKAMRAIDSFEEGTDMKAWLMTILRRTHIDMVRGNKLQNHAVSIEQSQMDLAEPEHPMQGEQDDKWQEPAALLEKFGDSEVINALKELPQEILWTLLLVDVEQMDHAATAKILEVPVGTVKSRAHRGRAMLRDKLYTWAKERGWVTREESSHA